MISDKNIGTNNFVYPSSIKAKFSSGRFSRNKFKSKYKNLLIFLFFVFFINFSLVSAAPIQEDLHVNLQTTDSSGNTVTGTYDFVFNVSTSSDCNNVIYSSGTETLTTDQRGIISYYLENVNLDYSEQYWLCYYRDGVLQDNSQIARTPYAFRAEYVNLSGVEVDSNFDVSGYNITADYFFGDGSQLTNLNVSEIDLGDYYTSAQIENFGYYNLSSFDINDYYLASNPNNYLNETTLNVSSVNYWTKNGTNVYYNDGNVGIGTTSPSYKLDVNGNIGIGAGSGISTVLSPASPGNGGFQIHNTQGSVEQRLSILDADGTYGSALIYETQTFALTPNAIDNGAIKFIIKDNGNVGIGTTTPKNKLDVEGGAVIGSTYSGTNTAPTNGLLVQGNVGIGTTSPGAKLEVYDGVIKSLGTNGDYLSLNPSSMTINAPDYQYPQFSLINSNANWKFQLNPGGSFSVQDMSTNNRVVELFEGAPRGSLTIASNGNLGIGTTSPQQKLHVNGSAVFNGTINTDGNKIINLANGTSAQDAVSYSQLQEVNSQLSGNISDNYVPYTGSTKAIVLSDYDFSVGGDNLFVDSSTGRVGVGTDSPGTALDVGGVIYSSSDVLADGSVQATNYMRTPYITPFSSGGNVDVRNYAGDASYLSVNTSSGNVGVGTTSPGAKLEIANVLNNTPSATNQHLMFSREDGIDYYGIMLDSSSRLKFTPRAGSSWSPTALILDQYGNVGIGTTDPTEKLEVSGNVKVSQNLTVSGMTIYKDTNGDMVFRS